MKFFRYLTIILGLASLLGAAQPQYKADIDAFKLKTLKDQGAVVIDIRTRPEWYETGIVPGSVPITFFQANGAYDIDGFMNALVRAVPDKGHPVVIICRTGNRSVPVADFLTRMGYRNVYNQKHGIVEWIGRGLPTVKP